MTYLLVKWLHILSATILFGTGVGSAFYMFMANKSRDLHSVVFATRAVVLADWLFTAPAVVLQLLTGLYLADLAGLPLTTHWVAWSLVLYFFAGACWLPVVRLQIKMRDLAKKVFDAGQELPPEYWRMARWWTVLGCLALPAIVVVFYLMVFK